MSHYLFLANQLHIECEGIADKACFWDKVSFFMPEKKKMALSLGAFVDNEEWVFAPNKEEMDCLCPAASGRCLDHDVKAIKESLEFLFEQLNTGNDNGALQF